MSGTYEANRSNSDKGMIWAKPFKVKVRKGNNFTMRGARVMILVHCTLNYHIFDANRLKSFKGMIRTKLHTVKIIKEQLLS